MHDVIMLCHFLIIVMLNIIMLSEVMRIYMIMNTQRGGEDVLINY
jgi:hypothetical protein